MQKSFGMKLNRVILILLVLTSCNAEKKLQRLVKKNPELLQADTITIQDTLTVITNKVQTDTLTSLKSITNDTLIITKENLTVKTVYNYETDSIFVYGECDTDTITKIIERQIPYNKIEVKKQNDLKIWFILVVVVLIFLFTFRPS